MGLEEPGGRESADPACASEELIRNKPHTRSCLNSVLLLIWLPTDDFRDSLPSSQHLGLSGSPSGTPTPDRWGRLGVTVLCLTPLSLLRLWVTLSRGGLLSDVPQLCLPLGRWDCFQRSWGVVCVCGVQTCASICSPWFRSSSPGHRPPVGDLWGGPLLLSLPLH